MATRPRRNAPTSARDGPFLDLQHERRPREPLLGRREPRRVSLPEPAEHHEDQDKAAGEQERTTHLPTNCPPGAEIKVC
jgi:hypothetical protein